MKFRLWILGWILFFGVSCTLQAPPDPWQDSGTPFGVIPSPQATSTPTEFSPTFTSTTTPTKTLTPTITSTPTITLTPTPTLIYHQAGDVSVPILLYYHVDEGQPDSRFYVSPDDFRAQMEYLRDNDYTAITITDLILVLINGGELPASPVVITFDGGGISIYENAFPIMQEVGFVGVAYLVTNRLYAEEFMNIEQLTELVSAGWQIGSQGMSHQDVTLDRSQARQELLQSRLDLESQLDVRVTTFAYPYGLMDGFIAGKLEEYGYYSAVGLGNSAHHTWGTLYYLSRFEILGDVTLSEFVEFLP